MSIYVTIIAVSLILGFFMPQQGPKRKNYIVIMAILQCFVCAFRYNHLTGDLVKYHAEFNTVVQYGWFSSQVFHEGRNTGFYMFMKLVNHLSGGNFQMVLIIISVFCEYVMALIVYRYSPKPWMSYMIWNCLGFYIFGFNAIKQALSMAFVMLSVIGIIERRRGFYLLMMFFAGIIHAPALVFFPAYWIAGTKIDFRILCGYTLVGVLFFVFKNQIINLIGSFYYEETEELIYSGTLGNRFIMILLIVLCGVLLKGFQDSTFEALFHFMIVSAILQMLSGFDHIFTRLTDYYFQISILYIPMLFSPGKGKHRANRLPAVFQFNRKGLQIFCAVVSCVLLWFFYMYTFNRGQLNGTYDDPLNYRFMWEVP